MIGITTIAYNQPEGLKRMVDSAIKFTDEEIIFFIFRHSNDPHVILACEQIVQLYDGEYPQRIYHLPFGKNRGVAKSWNDGIKFMMAHECSVMIICNDDIWFTGGDIDKIVRASIDHQSHYAIFCAGHHVGYNKHMNDHGMACFAIQDLAIQEIGMFDENFFPAYNEDIDYELRARLLGLAHFTVEDTNVHHQGSSTIQTSRQLKEQNYMTHSLNDEYWWKKWHCKKGEIGYPTPFNDPNLGLYISPEDRNAPYPGHNRTDQDIVKL